MSEPKNIELIRLHDGREGVRRGLAVSAKAMGDEPETEFVASDATLDRYDEVVEPAGWRLENYRKNPVIQNAHRYGDVLDTLGKALTTEVKDGKLVQRVRWAVEANPIAKIVEAMYRGGFLNAVSVGFIPIRWEDGSRETTWRRRFLEQELLEVSAVSVPANPNALQLACKSGIVSGRDVDEAMDVVRMIERGVGNGTDGTDKTNKNFGGDGATQGDASATAQGRELAQLLQHLRAARDAMVRR